MADANKAIELDPTMHKAYYRKGLEALFILKLKLYMKEHSRNRLSHIFFIYVTS